MTNEPSPRPWQVRYGDTVADAAGAKVAACWRPENAALIVDAVNYYKPDLHCDWRELTPNEAIAHCHEVAARLGDTPCARDHLRLAEWIAERDRLRDLVLRMADALQGIMDAADGNGEGVLDEALLREARAAVGEDTSP